MHIHLGIVGRFGHGQFGPGRFGHGQFGLGRFGPDVLACTFWPFFGGRTFWPGIFFAIGQSKIVVLKYY